MSQFHLTPAKRALLEALLKEKNLNLAKRRTIPRRNTDGPAPLSFAQQRMWFLSLLERSADVYNVPTVYHLQGHLDVPALEHSLNRIIQRHEILRTIFVEVDGEARQVVMPEMGIRADLADLRTAPYEERLPKARQILVELGRKPFDLKRGPLLRVDILQLDEQECFLMINLHHIVIDEWSMDVLLKELQKLYSAEIEGRSASLPELPIQYADYAAWQKEWLNSGPIDEQLAYWRDNLAGAPQMIELRHDLPRPATQSYRGDSIERQFPRRLLDELRGLSKTEQVTLFTILLAAFQVLLYRYTGQADVMVGTPIANRRQIELENSIGFFLNTLVLRSDLSGSPTFRELLNRVGKKVLEAFDNQDLPFERLVEELNPQRDLSRHSLFQVSFVLGAASSNELQLPGLQIGRERVDFGWSKFDLSLSMVEQEQGLLARLEYSTDLYLPATIEQMLEHYGVLLQGIVANPDTPVERLPLLDDVERNRILYEWNTPWVDYPRGKCVHQLFEEQVQRTPDAVAVISENLSLTYLELESRANQLARYLQSLGVGPDILVGVCMESSLELVVALLGVLKAGGAYVPIDPNYPEQRISFMLADTQAPVLITKQDLLQKVEPSQAKIVRLDTDWPAIARELCERPTCGATPENLAYVIYTSGSTGVPKGAMISHLALCNHMTWMQANYPLTADDKVLQKTLITFDGSVWEFYAPLLAGAQLVISRPGGHRDISYMLETVQHQGITILQAVPSILRLLVEDRRFRNCASLRRLFCGGEALTLDLADQVNNALDLELVNLYGPAEACINTLTMVLPRQANRQVVPIGRPVANSQVFILDNHLQPVPVGVPGEIFIGGDNLGRGYWDRPDLTADRFIPNPFSLSAGRRIYCTGDRGRYLSDGNVEFLGRLDDQVKLAGMRIELGEIEAALLAHPRIHQAVVTLYGGDNQQDCANEKRLVAYLVLDMQGEIDLSVLRSDLKSKLPDYMLPAFFVQLPALPLSPNGKVDRKALPAPMIDRSEANVRYAPPRDDLENRLCQVWEAVLDVHPVGIFDNFFELGGHSLLAIRLAGRIEAQLSRRLPIAAIFQSPTVAGLTEILQKTADATPRQIIPRRETDRPTPMSFGQERMWFLEQLGVMKGVYNVPSAFRVRGHLDVAALERSLNHIIRRHEILRTTFMEMDGEVYQVVMPELVVRISLADLHKLPEGERLSEARRILVELGQEAFDLTRGPLIRVNLLRMGEEDHFLMLNLHHIVTDEWSSEVFNQELRLFYDAEVLGEVASQPELPVQYADYAAWQAGWLRGSVEAEQLDYWKKKLCGALQALDLPGDHPRPSVSSYRGAWQGRHLNGDLLHALRRLCQSEGATLFVGMLAAFQALLFRYTGQADLLVGSPIANRRQPELENLIGFFLNTLVFRADFSGNPSFREALRRVSVETMEAFERQDLPFERLVEELKPQRDLSRQPLFQTMFVYHPPQLKRLQISGLEIEPERLDYGWSKFDLTLFASEHLDGVDLTLEYSTDLFEAQTIERMLEHYELLLRGMADKPDWSIGSLPMLTKAEQECFRAWNDTRADYPKGICVHQLVEAQAERTPEALAVEQPGGNLTYAELNERANFLAHSLRAMGVVPDSSVGIYLERSSEMLIALLAILKAGGACLPLDSAYPRARLEYMCADAQMGVILTQRKMAAELPESSARIYCLDSESRSAIDPESANPVCYTSPDNLAYILYTSGSTGQPKGVMMRHQPLVNLISWQLQNFSAPPDARTLQLTSLNFDVSFQEILATWSAGGALVLVSEQMRKDIPRLLEYIQEKAIKRLFLPFVALQLLAESATSLEIYPDSLQEVITAGEQLQITGDIQRFFERLPGCCLHNQYGPTETHVVSSYSLQGAPQSWSSLPPIGKPIANTLIRLLDGYGGLAPLGVIGEIYLGGDCLARGYLWRPELTAERFAPDPLGTQGERLYRTGDLGHYLADGNLQFLGRADQQVKIRGYRVEPAEVELVLTGHPQVRQAAVLAPVGKSGERRLAAYLTAEAEATLQVEELRNYLRARLPDYMIPAEYLVLEALPLTPSGKVNRLALADLAPERLLSGAGYSLPRDEVERRLCQIWEGVLGISPVGVQDDFFEVGGHSLLAIRLFTRIERELGQRLPLSTLFEAPTVAQLAEYLRSEGQAGDWSPLVVIQGQGSQLPFFCVHNFGGEVINLNALSQALGDDQPFMGLQARGLGGEVEPHTSIPEMAAYYVQAIREYQSAGPYRLGGFCFGGLVAYEMACQLQAKGEQVELLALLDAYAPVKPRQGRLASRLQWMITFFKNLPYWWRDFFQLDLGERRVVVKRRFTRVYKFILRLLGQPAEMTPRELIGDHAHVEEAPTHVKRLMELHILALMNYKPVEYTGRVTLFRTQRMPLFGYVAPDAGWSEFARGGVELAIIPGAHQNILRPPYVQELAKMLSQSLQEAHSRRNTM